MEPRKLALRIAAIAKSKKAQELLALDVRNSCAFCDYFVILSATSVRAANAIAEAIQEDLDKKGLKPVSRPNPNDDSGWVVLDYQSVLAHIFYKPMREFYSLERLWSDAKRVRIPSRIILK